jgi:poly-gamma-glutamate synthesis protein (capsule biosynthesis protein)
MVVAIMPLNFVLYSQQRTASASDAPKSGVSVRRARIVAAGDLMQHTPQISAALQSNGRYDYSASFQYVAPYFQNADLAIVNLETTLSHEGPYSGYPAFCSPAAVADALRTMSVDVVAMANNHCCDRGERGIESTCSILDSYGLSRVGVYRDSVDYKLNRVLYLKRCGIRFAVVNYTYDTNGIPIPKNRIVNLIDTLAIAQDLATIRREDVDCVVAIMHWGYEYQRKAYPEQRKLAAFLQRNGVDLIIGSHPHVVQPVERADDGRLTLYSLGNFVSNQRKRYSDGGLVATIDVEIRDSLVAGRIVSKSKSYNLTLTPVWVMLPKYVVLPQPVADTMSMSVENRSAYNLFVDDTRSLLGL